MAEEKERKELPQVDPIETANIDYIEVLGEKAKDLAENYIEYLGGKLENIFPLYDMYIVAKSNVLDRIVLDYIFNLDNDDMFRELVDYELTPLAKEQKCKTEFLNHTSKRKGKERKELRNNRKKKGKNIFPRYRSYTPTMVNHFQKML